ncbi:ribonuclease H-like domain-containing protein [Tanacetum coccineum]
MTYSGVNTSVQLLYVYLPAHPPPALFVSLSAKQLPMHYYGAPAMSPTPASYAPALPHAFHTMTLQNPNWNMDTGASSHLADNTVSYPTSPLPRSHIHALRDPNWKEAMLDEYNALITNETWVFIPRPANANVVRSMWLFKHKFNADGTLSRYKARLVANRRNQQQGIDCDETFSLVVKPATIRTVLSLAVSHDWPIHQLDVKECLSSCHLSETVYASTLGFVDPKQT